MSQSLEDALISVWRQVLVENAKTVTLNDESYPVRQTSRSKLREVDFQCEGKALRGVEQNASTNSRWAKLAREGRKVMQFLTEGRYVANVVDGKATVYQSLRERKESYR
jgi:hypothetical protein